MQVDVLPRDHARRNLLEQRAQREGGHDPLARAAGCAPRAPTSTATTSSSDVAVDRRRVELDVVDAHDLAAVDVDDLLVEEVALEQQHAVETRVNARQPDGIAVGAHARPEHLDRFGRQHALAVGRPDDQIRDARRMILRGDRDFAHASSRGAAGVADGRAEQFGERDKGHS